MFFLLEEGLLRISSLFEIKREIVDLVVFIPCVFSRKEIESSYLIEELYFYR